jgi:hypothetical protein
MSLPMADLYSDDDEPMSTVSCDSCKKVFTSFSLQDRQGPGCSCFVQSEGVYGEYGSEHFSSMFLKWKNGEMPPDTNEGDVLCDDCVLELVENNVVESGFFEMLTETGV